MSDKNATKTVLLNNVIRANSVQKKIVGLLQTKTPQPIYIQTRFGIHTFGMKYAIDVIILDDNFIVKKIKENLKPQQIFFWNPKYQHVLELPEGTITNMRIHANNKIFFT